MPRGTAEARVRMRAAFLVALSVLVIASALVSGAGAAGNRVVTVYSVATGVQYINTADDRARGHLNNPLDDAANKLAPKSSGSGKGPFAGDVAIYALSLYSDRALKRAAGSAVYTCYFNYDQHALCKAYFKLKRRGTLVASGPIDFKFSRFTIVVTGGTSTYLGVRGEVKAVAGGNSSRVDFRLIG
jgi:hypothetical protein